MSKEFKFTASDCLIILLIFHLIVNIIWIKINNSPPAWDEAKHTWISLEFLHSFQSLTSGNFSLKEFLLPFSDAYGPSIRLFTGFLLFVFGPSIKLAQFVGTITFLLSILMTYLLGKIIFKNEWIGLLAAFIFSFYLVIYDNSRWLLLDIGMVFFILLSIYWLIKSNFFEDKKYSLFTFLSFSLVALTKLQGLIYFIFPFGYSLVLIIKNKKLYRFRKIILGAFGFLSLVSLWILPNMRNIIEYYFIAVKAEPFADPTNLFDPTTWFHYLKLFIDYEIGFFVFLFFLVSLFYYLKSKANLKVFTLFFIAFYYVLFTLFPNKDMRYLFPVLPFTALVFAKGFSEIYQKRKPLVRFMLLAIIVFNVVMNLSLSFGFPLPKGSRKQVDLPYIEDIVYFNLTDYPVRVFDSKLWPQEKIIKDLQLEAKSQRFDLVFIPNYDHFNDNNFWMYLSFYKIKNINIIRAEGRKEFNSQEEVKNYLKNFTYFLYTPNEVGVFYQIDKKAFEQIQDELNKLLFAKKAKILNTYFLPTGQQILLLRKI